MSKKPRGLYIRLAAETLNKFKIIRGNISMALQNFRNHIRERWAVVVVELVSA